MRPLPAALLVLLCLGAVGGLVLHPSGLGRTLRLRADATSLSASNDELRFENDRLRRELKALADDPAELERAAREELGLVRPGEVVFRLEDGDEALVP